MAKVVHFEIPVDDPERARTFYSSVLDWAIESWGDEGYWLATGEGEMGADGALITRGALHQSPVIVVGVASLDDTLAAAEAAGAEVLHGRQEIPGVGYSAYFRDPEGNTIGLFEPSGEGAGG